MAAQLDGKVALVTGAGSGIGRATALAFAREGAKVVVSDVDDDGGEDTVAQIGRAGGEAAYVHADVSRAAEVEALMARTIEAFGRLDCAHNNAGVQGVLETPIHEYPEQVWDEVISVNLKGVWLCLRYEVPHMLEQGGGCIVNTSSMAGLVGRRGRSAYVASKHGIIGLTRTAALEYGPMGIRVNAVCPGAIQTPMLEQTVMGHPEREAQFLTGHPLGRFGTADEVADAVVWLCSDSSSFVTGHGMVLDGGMEA